MLGKYHGGTRYPCTVVQEEGHMWRVAWDDGDQNDTLKIPEDLELCDTLGPI